MYELQFITFIMERIICYIDCILWLHEPASIAKAVRSVAQKK